MTRLTLLLALGLATPALAQDRLAIRLVFDPEAAAALQARGETVTVSTWFYGDPVSKDVPVDDMGLVNIASEEVTVEPEDQVVALGASVTEDRLALVDKPYVNVNVFSSRLTDEYNLLDCGIVDDLLGKVAGADNVIECRLLD